MKQNYSINFFFNIIKREKIPKNTPGNFLLPNPATLEPNVFLLYNYYSKIFFSDEYDKINFPI